MRIAQFYLDVNKPSFAATTLSLLLSAVDFTASPRSYTRADRPRKYTHTHTLKFLCLCV